MAELKTKATTVSVEDFLAGVEHDGRREDAKALVELMEEVTGQKAVMWGSSIIGFGKYRYKYESGREGEMCRVGFAPRKANMVVYNLSSHPQAAALLAKLGKHKSGKGCLYLGRLGDVDMKALRALIAHAWRQMAEKYGEAS